MSVRLTVALASCALGLAGCGSPAVRPPGSTPVPPQASIVPTPAVATPPIADHARLTSETLIELAQEANPNRSVFEAHRAAAEAAVDRASSWSNPELEVATGRAKARDANESGQRPSTTIGSVSIKQRFELPGKRAARIAAAQANRDVIAQESRLDRQEVSVAVRGAIASMTITQARLRQAQHAAELNQQVLAAVQRRVTAGESDQGDLARAEAEEATAQLAATAIQGEVEARQAILRIWCGDRLPAHFTIVESAPEVLPPLDLETLRRHAGDHHPRQAIAKAQQAAQLAELNAEERAWYPDVTLGVTGGRETDTNDVGVSVGIDVPLWNRNESGIAEAEAHLAQVRAEQRQENISRQRDLVQAWSAYENSRQQIAGLTARVLPAARRALEVRLAAFTAGDASLLEVIDSRRALLTAESSLVDAQEQAAMAVLSLSSALGDDPLSLHSTANSLPASAGARP